MIKSIQLEKLLALMIVTGLIFSFAVLAIPTTSADEGVEVLVVFGENDALNQEAWLTLERKFGVKELNVKNGYVYLPSKANIDEVSSIPGIVSVD